jgi:hypothetical protein
MASSGKQRISGASEFWRVIADCMWRKAWPDASWMPAQESRNDSPSTKLLSVRSNKILYKYHGILMLKKCPSSRWYSPTATWYCQVMRPRKLCFDPSSRDWQKFHHSYLISFISWLWRTLLYAEREISLGAIWSMDLQPEERVMVATHVFVLRAAKTV